MQTTAADTEGQGRRELNVRTVTVYYMEVCACGNLLVWVSLGGEFVCVLRCFTDVYYIT